MRTNALRLLTALSALCIFTAACGDDEASEAVDEEHDYDDDHEGHDHDDQDGHDHASGDHEVHDHDHRSPVDFEGADIPTLGVRVEPTRPAASTSRSTRPTSSLLPRLHPRHVEGEGHFHLYVDGTKVQRFYNEAIYSPA